MIFQWTMGISSNASFPKCSVWDQPLQVFGPRGATWPPGTGCGRPRGTTGRSCCLPSWCFFEFPHGSPWLWLQGCHGAWVLLGFWRVGFGTCKDLHCVFLRAKLWRCTLNALNTECLSPLNSSKHCDSKLTWILPAPGYCLHVIYIFLMLLNIPNPKTKVIRPLDLSPLSGWQAIEHRPVASTEPLQRGLAGQELIYGEHLFAKVSSNFDFEWKVSWENHQKIGKGWEGKTLNSKRISIEVYFLSLWGLL